MEEYTVLLREHLKKNRKWSRTMFKVVRTIYRAVTKGRINYEQIEKKLFRKEEKYE